MWTDIKRLDPENDIIYISTVDVKEHYIYLTEKQLLKKYRP